MIAGLGYALCLAALVVRVRTTDAPPTEPARPLAGEPLWLTRMHHAVFAAILLGAPVERVVAGGDAPGRLAGLALFAVGVVFYRDWRLAIIGFLIFPLAIIPIKEFGKRLRKFSRKSQQRMGSITTFLHETIAGNRIVKAFNMEEYEKRRFAEENDRFFKIVLKRVKIRALSHPLMELLGGIGVAIII